MNILYVTPFYPPAYGFGGPVVVAHSIAKQLARQGNNITVLTTDALDSAGRVINQQEVMDGVKVCRLPNISPKLAKDFNVYTPVGLRPYLRSNIQRYQLVHLHAFFTYLNIQTTRACLRHHIPYVLHLHESPVPLPVLGKVAIKTIFNAVWGKRMLTNAAAIIVVSGREKELLTKYLPELAGKITVIPNQLPEDLPVATVKRSDYGLSTQSKVLVSLSRLSRIKRIDAVIRALHQLVEQDPSYQLLVAGADEAGTKRELISLVGELGLGSHVKFLGQLDARTRAGLFSVADVYVLFSHYESFSISTLEALYYGVPVCLSRGVGVAPDIIPSGCGVLVNDPSNVGEAAKAIAQTYQQRTELSAHCPAALERFQPEKRDNQLLEIYGRLVAGQ
ncbi:MAG: glycosyltransferase family 4 protein [Patescibacteria group bacterium]